MSSQPHMNSYPGKDLRDCAALPEHPGAEMVASIGSSEFGDALLRRVARTVPVVQVAAFEIMSATQAHVIACSGHPPAPCTTEALSHDYVVSGFQRDPVTDRILASGLPRGMIVTKRDEISDPSYRQQYYDEPGVLEDITFWHVSGDAMLLLSLFRSTEQGAFTDEDRRHLCAEAAVMLSASAAHARAARLGQGDKATGPVSLSEARGDVEQSLPILKRAVESDPVKLSNREAEICAHLILGFCAQSIASLLGLSNNTVSTYRKRIYAKWRVTSHTELVTYALRAGYAKL